MNRIYLKYKTCNGDVVNLTFRSEKSLNEHLAQNEGCTVLYKSKDKLLDYSLHTKTSLKDSLAAFAERYPKFQGA